MKNDYFYITPELYYSFPLTKKLPTRLKMKVLMERIVVLCMEEFLQALSSNFLSDIYMKKYLLVTHHIHWRNIFNPKGKRREQHA